MSEKIVNLEHDSNLIALAKSLVHSELERFYYSDCKALPPEACSAVRDVLLNFHQYLLIN